MRNLQIMGYLAHILIAYSCKISDKNTLFGAIKVENLH